MREIIGRYGPVDDHFIGLIDDSRPVSRFDGLFWQPGDDVDCEQRREVVAPYMDSSLEPGLMPLDAYQDWVELDWKKPHGSVEALSRLQDKIIEEAALETGGELSKHIPLREYRSDEPYAVETKGLSDEIGDTLWVVSAIASNSGVSLNQSARTYMHQQDLAKRNGPPVQFVTVDYLLAAGHNPTLGPLDDPADPEDFEEYCPQLGMAALATGIRGIADRQFGYLEDYYTSAHFNQVARTELEPAVGQALFTLGYYSQQWARTTLGEVAQGNINKLSVRAANNQIDKSDGLRFEAEL